MTCPLRIDKRVLGMVQTNTYILSGGSSHEALVIDPADEGDALPGLLQNMGVRVSDIVLTHGHFDHITGVNALKKKFRSDVWIHELDSEMLADPMLNLSFYINRPVRIEGTPHLLHDGMEIAIGKTTVSVVHSPGHTPGSICLAGKGFVFSGDTLFRNSVGRTDLPGSSMIQLMDSIKNRLMDFKDDTVVYPGHGDDTTIGRERTHNPYAS
jgi:hydroxyacylglutathione hydrolase